MSHVTKWNRYNLRLPGTTRSCSHSISPNFVPRRNMFGRCRHSLWSHRIKRFHRVVFAVLRCLHSFLFSVLHSSLFLHLFYVRIKIILSHYPQIFISSALHLYCSVTEAGVREWLVLDSAVDETRTCDPVAVLAKKNLGPPSLCESPTVPPAESLPRNLSEWAK